MILVVTKIVFFSKMVAKTVAKLYFFLLILGLSKVNSEALENGTDDQGSLQAYCPDIKILTDLNITEFYNGKPWYEVKKNVTDSNIPPNLDCAQMRLNLVLNYEALEAKFDFDYDNPFDFVSLNGIINDTSVPYVTVTFPSDSKASLFYILDTDYDNYALAYSCSSDPNDNSTDRIWLLSRTEEPDENTTALIEYAIANQTASFQGKLDEAQGCEEIHNLIYCRQLKNKDDLDLEKYTEEVWFEQYRSQSTWEDDTVCANVTYDYNSVPDPIMKVYHYNSSGNLANYFSIYVNITNNEVIFYSSNGKELYNVIDTDYDNYATVYGCSQRGKSDIEERLWILGKYSSINSNVTDGVNEQFGDSLELNITCPVPKAPPTTTTVSTSTVKSTSESTTGDVNNQTPPTTTEQGSSSSGPEDRPPAFILPGYEDYKFYYVYEFENE